MSEPTPAPTPSRAVYGFAWFLFFKTAFILYVFWAFVPEQVLEEVLGLTYLPNKYFALCVPCTVVLAVLYAFIIYPLINLAMQDDINDPHTIHDPRTIRRCSFIDQINGKRCERKVNKKQTNGNEYNIWIYETFCENHKEFSEIFLNTTENGFCDCIDRNNCFLAQNPNHLRALNNRCTVPSISDIDISAVSKQLYLDQ